ncbi:hypothetical protein LC087_12285 [Bacillus carboniphilus]|uniref:Uncharacterized protein n=1 Tax=Bacillus carboniphilus TaxID=86663 RepID=A0ABY9JQG4_9BACI|nr:hypothetical protein [Bacillus carboniphilus]WLR41646.1 hypothetical protein LC087_12285 [Bacillus carboniphilus]
MEKLFEDIVFQLSHNKGTSIEVLCDVSKKVKKNMEILHEQVDRVTMN